MDKAENDDKSNDNFKTFKTKGRRESRLAGGRGWGIWKNILYLKKFKTLKKGGPGSRLAGGSSPTPSQSSEKTLNEAEIAVSRILTSAFDSMLLLPMIALTSSAGQVFLFWQHAIIAYDCLGEKTLTEAEIAVSMASAVVSMFSAIIAYYCLTSTVGQVFCSPLFRP